MSRLRPLLQHPLVRIAGPLAGVTCAGIFVAGLDSHEFGAAIGQLSWWWLAPVLALGCVNLWLRAVRWGVLLAPVAPLPTSKLLGVGLTSAFASMGLPARGGDAVRVLLATRLPGVNLADVAAAELLERLVDGAIFGAFIAVATVLSGVEGWPLTLGLAAVAVYLPILASIPIAGWYLTVSPARPFVQEPRWHPRQLIEIAATAVRRRGPSILVRAAQLSFLAWAFEAASYYCLLVAFGWIAPPALPFAAVGVANFAFAVPGAPAGVGTFHVPVSALLVDGFGAEPSLAAAYAVVLHVAVLAPVPVLWLALAARARWIAVPARIRVR